MCGNFVLPFNPLTREFAVWTQAFERNPEWISEISSVFAADQEHNISKFRKAYIKTANEGRAKNNEPVLTEDEEDIIEENINDLLNQEYLQTVHRLIRFFRLPHPILSECRWV